MLPSPRLSRLRPGKGLRAAVLRGLRGNSLSPSTTADLAQREPPYNAGTEPHQLPYPGVQSLPLERLGACMARRTETNVCARLGLELLTPIIGSAACRSDTHTHAHTTQFNGAGQSADSSATRPGPPARSSGTAFGTGLRGCLSYTILPAAMRACSCRFCRSTESPKSLGPALAAWFLGGSVRGGLSSASSTPAPLTAAALVASTSRRSRPATMESSFCRCKSAMRARNSSVRRLEPGRDRLRAGDMRALLRRWRPAFPGNLGWHCAAAVRGRPLPAGLGAAARPSPAGKAAPCRGESADDASGWLSRAWRGLPAKLPGLRPGLPAPREAATVAGRTDGLEARRADSMLPPPLGVMRRLTPAAVARAEARACRPVRGASAAMAAAADDAAAATEAAIGVTAPAPDDEPVHCSSSSSPLAASAAAMPASARPRPLPASFATSARDTPSASNSS